VNRVPEWEGEIDDWAQGQKVTVVMCVCRKCGELFRVVGSPNSIRRDRRDRPEHLARCSVCEKLPQTGKVKKRSAFRYTFP